MTDEPTIDADIQELEFDEMWHFIQSKKEKSGLLKPWISRTGRTIAWVLSSSDAETFQRLYDKVKHLTDCVFYTDDWEAFAQVLPKERHIIGKAHTHTIERDNSNIRTPPCPHDATDQGSLQIERHDSCLLKAVVCPHSARDLRGISGIVSFYL